VLSAVADFVEGALRDGGVAEDIVFCVHLAVDEACTNIISYSRARSLSVSIQVCMEDVTVIITDDGIAFDPLTAKPPDILGNDINNRQPGGLGVYLIRKSVDEVTYARREGKNVLRMVKRRR
jgi:anti-sigma regulatory factor (Ser/Thr protein kinase)